MTENIYNSLISYEWDNINYHYLNRYVNFINSLLEKRENKKFEHSEKHHIVPRAMNGTNNTENLIYLSYREHFLAHYMLAKAFVNHSIVIALRKMMDGKNRINENSRLYEQSKILVNEAMSELFSGEGNPFYGKTHNEITKEKLRKINLGKHHTDETKKKMSLHQRLENHPNWGKHLSDETKKRISESKKGKHPNISNEIKEKISIKLKESALKRFSKNKIMNDGVNTIFVPLENVEEYLKNGYMLGRPKSSEETKKKISDKAKERFLVKSETNIKLSNAAKKRKGKKLMNNGIISKYVAIDEIEYYKSIGFIFGKIKNNN